MEENEVQSASMVRLIADSELDKQISTALAYPRKLAAVLDEASSLATRDLGVATDCMYALPRKQKDAATGRMVTKNIEGPTVRFAEILGYCWGNMRIGARVVDETGDYVIAQGIAHDLQKNICITMEVRRKITGRDGQRFSADMVAVTGQAAAAIARRNATLAVIPKPLWQPIYESAVKVIKGDSSTLVQRRDKILQRFQQMSVTPEMVCRSLGIDSVLDITLDDLVTLIGIGTALKDGTTTVEVAFADPDEPIAGERSKLSEEIAKMEGQAAQAAPATEIAPDPSATPQDATADDRVTTEPSSRFEAPVDVRVPDPPSDLMVPDANVPIEMKAHLKDEPVPLDLDGDEPTVAGFRDQIMGCKTVEQLMAVRKEAAAILTKEEVHQLTKVINETYVRLSPPDTVKRT